MDSVNVPTKLPSLKSVVLPVPQIIRGIQNNLGSPWIRPRSLFFKIFNGFFFGWTLWTFWSNLKSVPAIIAIGIYGFLGRVANPQSWGGGSHKGRGWYRSKERWWVSSYRPSIVTFPLSLRVSEILSLLCSSTPLFPHPTSSLLHVVISPRPSHGLQPIA